MTRITNPILTSLKLTEPQAAVYLAALELGQATIQGLSRKSGVPRASIYRFIDELRARQLIEETRKGGRNYYSATNPEQLLEIEQTRIHELRKIIPELAAIQNKSNKKPRVRFFDGVDGIKAVYADMLKDRQNIISFADYEYSLKTMGRYYDEVFIPERKKRGIWYKTIVPNRPSPRQFIGVNNRELREMRFMPGRAVNNEINIYNNKVAINSYRADPPYSVLIEDQDLAESMTAIWEQLWDRLK